MLGPILKPNPSGPLGTCGKPLPFYNIELIDQESEVEIKEPHITWLKGPCFTECYQDSEETALAFTPGGYFKTGDLLYRDEEDNYLYVERIKALIKYRNSHVIPVELEDVICKHPSVKDLFGIGIPDPTYGEHPVAWVVLQPGEHATAGDIKDLVAKMQQYYDQIHWYFGELTSRVVAETGISSDRQHLGKILLRCLKDAPDFISQIDGGTGEEETNKSVLERTVLCASSFRNFGLNYQDVVVVLAPNHLHISIPLYAAFCIGLSFAGLDNTLGENELVDTFNYCQPKMVLCQSSKAETVRKAITRTNRTAEIITFDKDSECMNFTEFIHKFAADATVTNFKASDFEPENTNAMLMSTSGSTGLPKLAVYTHRNICIGFINNGIGFPKFPTPFNIGLVLSPIQWISAAFQIIMSPIMRYTRLQTSTPLKEDHVYYLINKYRPEYTILSPTYLTTLLKRDQRNKCDFTSFKYMQIGGSAVPKELLEDLKSVIPSVNINIIYGITETAAIALSPFHVPLGSIGRSMGLMEIKLVDTITEKNIVDPNQPGELRLKGPSIVKGYYNNPEMTAAAFDEDGWFKTGDIVYRDEHFNFFFVDRLKMLLKYRSHQVSPVEIESVILKHPGILDVAVAGIPDEEYGDLPVAFVVKNEGHDVSSQDIVDLVKESLTDSKQLRGGVVFINALPLTSTSKVDRAKLKKMAINLKKLEK